MTIKNFLLLLLFFTTSFLFAQEKQVKAACIGFYNFENLFDTEDDPEIKDDEFTPKGKRRWEPDLYNEKIDNMASVVSQLGTDLTKDGVAILGVAEVENKKVLEDFVLNEKIADRNYKIVHHDSPDKRGIDVAMLYQEKYFTYTHKKEVPLMLYKKDGSRRFTRDIVVVSGKFDGEDMHVLLNHWPSRSGGENRSKKGRNDAGKICKTIVDSLYKENPMAKVIVMGDLNDDPNSPSVKKFMAAKDDKKQVFNSNIYNPFCKFYKKGLGTTAWRDAWSLFDQILVSGSLVENKNNGYAFYKAEVFKKPWMLQKSGQYQGYPYRTFVGDVYQGGYSDHLPVLIYLVKEVQ